MCGEFGSGVVVGMLSPLLATGTDYGNTLRALLADREVDAVIAVFTPPLVESTARGRGRIWGML
ncbi:hypothetical protein AB0M12_15370 [Nocardia vinacea]|uniref:hypothetical protein n=1 Tax=Nocardia vinacea TaxID=96468 RepID=UPI00343EB8E9